MINFWDSDVIFQSNTDLTLLVFSLKILVMLRMPSVGEMVIISMAHDYGSDTQYSCYDKKFRACAL